ncbi:thiol reductase thioredoxin [candidate division KSB1 bacterium]|nr:thiol reductase thioredoxin [candidate division KSB1 bacterium]
MKKKANLLALTDKNFNHQVLENLQPVLVHFRTDWSGSSDIITPIIEELALKFAGEVSFGKLDTDNHNQIAMKFGIESVPTLIFFNHGRVVDRTNGVISKSELTNKLKALLGK